MSEVTCHVFPSENPLSERSGEERRRAVLEIVGRVEELITERLGASLQEKRVEDGYMRFSVEPGAVTQAAGAELPVREVLVMFSVSGDPMTLPIYAWSDGSDAETPVSVCFGECFFFEEGSQFFRDLAAAFGSGGVVIGGMYS